MPHPTGGYRNAAGDRIPGTTTIIGRFKDSKALLFWAFKQGQSGASHLYEKTEEAAEIGTMAHGFVERHINLSATGRALTIDDIEDAGSPEIFDPAWRAFEAYLRWERMTHLTIVAQEIELVSEQYQFGGCPDAIGMIDDELCLVDWKTSNGVYVDHLIQLAAYRQLWEENYPDQPLTGGFHLCRFAKGAPDFHHHHWSDLSLAWEQFRLFRQAYENDKRLRMRL